MALKKIRSFNRGKSYLDFQALAGATNKTPGISTAVAKGARWDINGGTIQRNLNAPSTTNYPFVVNGATNLYTEDFGALSDLYAAGGYCTTMYARFYQSQWNSLYSPDGQTIRGISSALRYQDSPNFYDFGTTINLPQAGGNTGGLIGYIAGAGWITTASTGELLLAGGATEYVARWDSATNPTTCTQIASSLVPTTPTFFTNNIIYQDGFYYFFGTSNASTNSPGMIYRSPTFALSGGSFVHNVANNVRAKGDWFPQHNCFISVGGTGYNGPGASTGNANILRSTDGITWTNVYTHATVNTRFMDVMMHPSGRLIAVGLAGCCATSDDGGLTWTARSSSVPSTLYHLMCLTMTPDNLVCAVSGMATSAYSADGGLTWTHVENDYGGAIGATLAAFWRPITVAGQLYIWRSTGALRWVAKYTGKGQWQPVVAIEGTANASGSTGNPAGMFWADPYPGTGNLTGARNMLGFNMTTTGIFLQGSANTGVWGNLVQVGTANDQNWHKLQIEATAVPNQALPTFNLRAYLDDNLVGGPYGPYSATTVNQRLWLTTSSFGFNMFSDFVVNDFSGTRNNLRPATDMQIRPRLQTGDVGVPQWEKVPAGTVSNAVAAQGDGSIISAPSYVQSDTTDQTDQYTGQTWATPPGYKIAAVSVSGVAQRLGIPTPSVEMSMTEGGSSLPAASATLAGATTAYAPLTVLYETKLDQAGWTDAAVNSSAVQLKRTT